MNQKTCSFVNDHNELASIKGRSSLCNMISQINERPEEERVLRDLDLSEVDDLSDLNLSGYTIENVIFNKYDACEKDRKVIFNVNFKGCTLKNVSFTQCKLIRCNFDSYSIKHKPDGCDGKFVEEWHLTTMNRVDFFFCEFETCRFKSARMDVVDFRYSALLDCSLGYLQAKNCDFYMTAFKGTTNFPHSRFTSCSITNATFENHCITMSNIDDLVQERYDDYHRVIMHTERWNKQNPCADFSYLNKGEEDDNRLMSRAYISKEASQVYSILSGIYAGKGLCRDSNLAYRKSKINEGKHYFLQMRVEFSQRHFGKGVKNLCKMAGPVSSRLFGYGYQIMPVVAWFVALIVGYGLYHHRVAARECDNFRKEIAYSLYNSLGPYADFIRGLNEILASFQTGFGMLLIGFMGFVLANRIRNNG